MRKKSLTKTQIIIKKDSLLSLTKTQVQENLTKIFELIAALLVAGCLVSVAAASIFIALVGIFRLF